MAWVPNKILILMVLSLYTGNDSNYSVSTSTTTPIYEEILPSYSQTLNINQETLEFQENIAYKVATALKLQENAAYQTTMDIKLNTFELQDNAAYISTTCQLTH